MATISTSSAAPSSGMDDVAKGQTKEEPVQDDWPLLPEHQRPLTSRLAQLIAHTPSIDITEANDRRALLHHRRAVASADAEPGQESTAALPPPASPASPRLAGQRRRRSVDGLEAAAAAATFVPTFRGGGDGEGGDDDVDEERLSRVQPDPLYDPHMDDADQQHLQAAHSQPTSPTLPTAPPLNLLLFAPVWLTSSSPLCCPLCCAALPPPGRESDAVLSCPCCFTTLCLDCQRHTSFASQYRAMFVQHCRTLTNRPVQPRSPSTPSRKRQERKRHRQREGAEEEEEEEVEEAKEGGGGAQGAELFFPVCCNKCGTEVGVVDADEVYHFYHVLDTGVA